ncbi:lipoma-preferred partner homolog isoform X1 [Stegodyphus dumicola]|uniref:lipoma-preferred partner homolog isoform X1 n=2 Tax=Stegodyphus dumicola TaxID=202533 RepID=UPI0015A9B4AB|nr:lipoma-preferred partner homolog isoform X1 [Stegodyphus dumicola]
MICHYQRISNSLFSLPTMTSNQDMLVRDMGHLQISNYSPQQYSSNSKKIAPVVPPKPKSDMYATVGAKSNGMYHSSVHPPPQPASVVSTINDPIYSNFHPDDNMPPPPPPPPQVTSYSPPPSQHYPPPPPDAVAAPSSPASSTYGTQAGYSSYRPNSSVSSYDTSSIYEPITPRPPSQMSNRSNYSMGSGSSSLYSSYYPASGRGKGTTGRPTGKEAEVDRLTDLMVQSMENSSDPEFYEDEEEEEIPVIGMCYKCGEKVLGEGSGCTAMEHVYHISCFTCHICHKELRGKPFYAKDGKPFCEDDYLNTLEKCCVCGGRILDRILRATGKPYHPNCFTCVVCGKCLDGIPFTVDATNQIYCIDDFHKKFAPRCCVCKQPIMPEHGKEETVRVVALDRSFHVQCYRCEDCGLRLSSEAEGSCYPLDDHILCRSCNAKRVQALTSCMTTEL